MKNTRSVTLSVKYTQWNEVEVLLEITPVRTEVKGLFY